MDATNPQSDADGRGPLLLHSLAEFEELILACLDIVEARSLVEIGSEEGTFTGRLADWATERDASLYAVDPAPRPALLKLAEENPSVHLIRERSPEALDGIEPADAYLVDGDHNYYTVFHELEAIHRRAEDGDRPYLVVLHDVAWPSGRRDMYYDPAGLPADAVREHSFDKGVVPESAEVVDGGFRGAGNFGWALREGGPENGVRTAVEDFMRKHDGFELIVVPCIFGLGVLFPVDAPRADELRGLLSQYHENPLLARLERNRLALYLRVLELQDSITAVVRHRDDIQLARRDAEVENRALWARNIELEETLARRDRLVAAVDHLVGEVEGLTRSGAFSLAERISRLAKVARPGATTLSRARLKDGLDAVERER